MIWRLRHLYARLTARIPRECTGAWMGGDRIDHDGPTCPVHERNA